MFPHHHHHHNQHHHQHQFRTPHHHHHHHQQHHHLQSRNFHHHHHHSVHHHQHQPSFNINNNKRIQQNVNNNNNNFSSSSPQRQPPSLSSLSTFFSTYLSQHAKQQVLSKFFSVPIATLNEKFARDSEIERLAMQGESLLKSLILESTISLSKCRYLDEAAELREKDVAEEKLKQMRNNKELTCTLYRDDVNVESPDKVIMMLVKDRVMGNFMLGVLAKGLDERLAAASSCDNDEAGRDNNENDFMMMMKNDYVNLVRWLNREQQDDQGMILSSNQNQNNKNDNMMISNDLNLFVISQSGEVALNDDTNNNNNNNQNQKNHHRGSQASNNDSSSSSLPTVLDFELAHLVEINKPFEKFWKFARQLRSSSSEQEGNSNNNNSNSASSPNNNNNNNNVSPIDRIEQEVLLLGGSITSSRNLQQQESPQEIHRRLQQGGLVLSNIEEKKNAAASLGRIFYACLYLSTQTTQVTGNNNNNNKQHHQQPSQKGLNIARKCFVAAKRWFFLAKNDGGVKLPITSAASPELLYQRLLADKKFIVVNPQECSLNEMTMNNTLADYSVLDKVGRILEKKNHETNFVEMENLRMLKREQLVKIAAAQVSETGIEAKKDKMMMQQENSFVNDDNNSANHHRNTAVVAGSDKTAISNDNNNNNSNNDNNDDDTSGFGMALSAVAFEISNENDPSAKNKIDHIANDRRREREENTNENKDNKSEIPKQPENSANNNSNAVPPAPPMTRTVEIIDVHQHPRPSLKVYWSTISVNNNEEIFDSTREFHPCCGGLSTSKKPCASQVSMSEKVIRKTSNSAPFVKYHPGEVIEGSNNNNNNVGAPPQPSSCYAYWSCCQKPIVTAPPPSAASGVTSKYQIIPEFVSGCQKQSV